MRAPWSLDNVTIPAQGLSHEVGIPGAKLFVTVANNIILGGTPTTVEVLPNGSTQNLKIGYGTVMTFPINAEWVLITGAGANVSVRLSSIPMPLTVNVVSVSSISGTVNTDVGQGEQKGGNTTLNFGGTPVDPRDRNWTLGSGDTPSRSWALGSGDTPGRSWALGSSDVPGRGWTLGSTDTPGRSWSLGSGDTPGRSWGLGSNDNPDITVNQANPLGNSAKPVYIRTLGASDVPDVSQNQADTINTSPTYSYGSVYYAAPISAANQTIELTITIPPGAALELREFLVNLGSSLNIFANLSLASDQRNPDFLWGWASSQYVTLSAYSSLNLTTPRFQCVVANDQNATLSGNLGAATYIQSVHYGVHRSIINTTASNITWTYTFTSQVSAAYNVYWDVEYVGSNGITFSFTSTNAGSGGSSPPPPPACWTADTLISTPDGPKPFSALKVGDLVLTPLGPRPITDIIHNREKETVYQVRPSVWVTGDQRIRSIPPTETWTPLQIIRSGHSLEQRVEDTWDCKVESGWVRAYGGDEGDVYLYDKTA